MNSKSCQRQMRALGREISQLNRLTQEVKELEASFGKKNVHRSDEWNEINERYNRSRLNSSQRLLETHRKTAQALADKLGCWHVEYSDKKGWFVLRDIYSETGSTITQELVHV